MKTAVLVIPLIGLSALSYAIETIEVNPVALRGIFLCNE